jgi:hypothetical protein
MSTLVVGGLGNMGQRYCQILSALKEDYLIKDIGLNENINYEIFDYAIICTPTMDHMEEISNALRGNDKLRILCEKPLTKHPFKDDIHYSYLKAFKNIHMVNNYDYAFKRACRDQSNFVNATGLTTYEYYQTGRDGLLFDCIQLIKMAKADIELKGYGWKWQCQINGWRIDRNLIDDSYYDMIEDFISDKLEQTDLDELLILHKFIGLENEQFEQESLFGDQRKHWRASKDDLKKISGQSFANYGRPMLS